MEFANGRLVRVGTVLTGIASVFLPLAALACPVCFAAEERQLWAYLGTAVLLSLLPFLLFGGIVLWVRWEGQRFSRTGASEPASRQMSRAENISLP